MKTLMLSRELFTTVDDKTFVWAVKYKWHALAGHHTFYAVRNVILPDGRRTLILLHREILKAPPGVLVDHEDRNGLNNLLENIRLCNKQQNNSNQAIRLDNSTGYKGVHKVEGRPRPYVARIQVDRERLYLGDFLTAQEAAAAYNLAAVEFFGRFAFLNTL